MKYRSLKKYTQIDGCVDELNGEQELSPNAVTRLRVQSTPFLDRIQASKEGSVQPSSSLSNEDIQVGRNIRGCNSGVNYKSDPFHSFHCSYRNEGYNCDLSSQASQIP